MGARLRAVHVRPNLSLDRELEAAASRSAAAPGREQTAAAILDAAREWPVDRVVIGESRRPATLEPYDCSQTRSVLEFGEQPVLVVTPNHPKSRPYIGRSRPGRSGSSVGPGKSLG